MGLTRHLSFDGRIRRWWFLALSLVLIAIQQVLGHLLIGDHWPHATALLNPWLDPLHDAWFATYYDLPNSDLYISLLIGMILLTDWALAILAFRRMRTVKARPIVAAVVVIPFVQLASALVLAFMRDSPPAPIEPRAARWRASLIGMLVGAGIGVAGSVFSTLILHTYGIGLFLGVPLFMGFAAGYVADSDEKNPSGPIVATMGSLLLAALALSGFAIEGAICLVMASPLIAAMGAIGGAIGSAWAKHRISRRNTLYSFALLPLMFASESFSPPHAMFESAESIDIAAPPLAVWDSVVHMGPIPDKPAAPFGWGLAYPMRGTLHGSGVGAVREGVFSTGIAYERVTDWQPGHRLAFDVLSDPPSMRELSPYPQVHAPHVQGYFRTRDAIFTIDALPSGKTRLTLTTHHDLDIGPSQYWLMFARWAVHANKARVLTHFRTQAEHTQM